MRIRLPRFIVYFLGLVYCLFGIFSPGVNFFQTFNMDKIHTLSLRVGLFCWAISFLFLTIRNWYFIRKSLGLYSSEFWDGKSVVLILFCLGSLLIFISFLNFSNRAFYVDTPTATRSFVKVPTIIKPTTTNIPPTKTATPDCYHWSEITVSMNGKKVCVYGDVKSFYDTDEASTRIKFSTQPNTFFICSVNFVFPDLRIGDCVLAEEVVQVYNKNIPFMSISDLYYCESWMEK